MKLLPLCLVVFACCCWIDRVNVAQEANPKSPRENLRDLKLRDWQPRSMLKTKVTRVNTPTFPVIVQCSISGDSPAGTKIPPSVAAMTVTFDHLDPVLFERDHDDFDLVGVDRLVGEDLIHLLPGKVIALLGAAEKL